MASREQEVLQVVGELYRQGPDWITFFREVLGLDGLVRQSFQSAAELETFEKSEEYQQIQNMLLKLRTKKGPTPDDEPTTVITVRLPKALHDMLKTEAHGKRTSMNKLCIAKLLQVLDDAIPKDELTLVK